MDSNFTIKELHEKLSQKEIKATEVAEHYFNRIKEKDSNIGAYLRIEKESALESAKIVDEKIDRGEAISPLAGIPLAIKDNILIQDHIASAGSKILESYVAAYDATVIKKLREVNSVFLGKTNLDEFAMGASTENSAFYVTRNPHDTERVAGGSSGGSAAAVAANMTVAALGSDTGGSIRQPAHFCGAVGLRPTYGAVSRSGLIAMASSLDQIGPITKTVEDNAILFKAIAGDDELDSTSAPVTYDESILNYNPEEIKNLTIGIPKEYFIDGLEPEVEKGIQAVITELKEKGFKTKEVSLPHTKYGLSVYYIVVPAEVSSNLARYDGIRYSRIAEGETLQKIYINNKSQGFGAETKRRAILGTFVLSSGYYDAYYSKAQKVRRLIHDDFIEVFKDVDVLLTPVAPTRAFKIGEKTDDPLQMYLSDTFTIPSALASLPSLSIPVKQEKGELPIGFQFIGKHWREADLFGIGRMYEE